MKSVVVILFTILGCSGKVDKDNSPNFIEKTTVAGTVESKEQPQTDNCDSIKNTIGLVLLDDNKYEFGMQINILNEKGEILRAIEKTEERQSILFKCVSNEGRYKIYFDGVVTYLSKQNNFLKFVSWEDYITKEIFAIDFDQNTNAFRKGIQGDSIKGFKKNNNHRISPLSIKDEWLKIRYEDFNTGKNAIGWIKWKDQGCLLIDLFPS